jgi:hypothetical protein
MASTGLHRMRTTAPRAYGYAYRAWRFTQALGRLS